MGKVFKRLLVFLTVFLTCPAFAESSLIACDNPNAAGDCGFIPESDSDADCRPTPLTFEGQSPDNGTYTLTAQWEKDECPITLNSHTGTNEYGLTDSDPTTLYALYGDAVYLESAHTNAMSTSANGLTTNPTGKTYTLTLNTNVTTAGTGGMKAAHTDSEVTASVGTKAASTTATMSFAGFFDTTQLSNTQTNGTQYIGTDGKITTDGISAGTSISKVDVSCPFTEWHAQYTCQNADTYTPQLTGYRFMGWYDAANDGTRVIDFCLDSDKTVYAQWFATHYSITYDCNGGTIIDDPNGLTRRTYTVTYDDLYTFVSQAELCTYQNQTPSGWSCTNVTTPWYTPQNWNIVNDVECTAQWDDTPYTIEYKVRYTCNNGTVTGTLTVPNGGSSNVDTATFGDSYTFWSIDVCSAAGQTNSAWSCVGDTSGDTINQTTNAASWATAENVTCTMQYNADIVDLVYLKEPGDTTPYYEDTCNYGNSQFTLPSQPTKTGYTFTGWKVTNHQ